MTIHKADFQKKDVKNSDKTIKLIYTNIRNSDSPLGFLHD